MRLNSTFRKVAKAFSAEFDELSREVSHNLTSGESRESALAQLLRRYLPTRVGVDRGFVIDALGGESKQIDLIIYDRTVGTVFEAGGVKFFPCETVVAVGEIKSAIASSDKVEDALSKIKSVKSLDRSNGGRNLLITGPGISIQGMNFDPATKHRDQVFGFIFTSASLSKDNLISQLQAYNSANERRLWINLYCDWRNFLISYECPNHLYPSAMEAQYIYCTEHSEAEDLLLLFYCILATFVDEAHVARPSYFAYACIQDTKATYHDLVPSDKERGESGV